MIEDILSFLKQLACNNNREWFNAHKDQYLKVKSEVENLAQQIIMEMQDFEPDVTRLTPADCTYRIYRDTRFSSDKTPYKTHIGIYINPPYGKKSPRCGYYLHLEPGNCLMGGGAYCPEPNVLKALRQSIYDNIDEYLGIINDPWMKKMKAQIGSEPLKTAPKGFPKDWEYMELIKPRCYEVMIPLTSGFLKAPNLPHRLAKEFSHLKPITDFFNFTIDEEV